VATFAYISLLLLAVRGLARSARLTPFAARKSVHVGIGVGTLVTTALYDHLGWALVPPAAFVLLNASGVPRRIAPSIAREGRDPALWVFPLAVLALYLLYWEGASRAPILAGLAALGFADPAAAVIGSRFGERRFAGWGHGRSVEGSLTYLAVSGLAAAVIAIAVPGGGHAVRLAVGCGFAGAFVEAISPAGIDNLTAPLAVAVAFRALA
jgi:phytol kinase